MRPGNRAKLVGAAAKGMLHVENRAVLADATAIAPHVDALLLDSGRPGAAIPELGGTGRVHDWDLSRELVAAVEVPVFLAGGLNPENVGEAIAGVRPHGVDVCSGLRRDGALDAGLLRRFVAAARAAFAGRGVTATREGVS